MGSIPMSSDTPNPLTAKLRACERELLDPAVRRDRERVSALLAEDFVEFGSSGKVWTREGILDLLATEDFEPPVMEDFECCEIAEGVALVTYKTIRTNAETGEMSVTLRSSIWSKGSGVWRMRFHQGTHSA